MNRFSTAFVISILLHVGLFVLVLFSWKNAPKPTVVASVPVELVSSVPAHEQAEAPVDELAVKPPEPEPAPEEPVKVEPKVEPLPKLPVPVPQKPVVKPEPKPEKKPDPKTAAKTPPDKNGIKKPEPKPEPKKDTKPSLDLGALSKLGAAPSKARTRTEAQANTRQTNGASNQGTSPADAGIKSALNDLGARLMDEWNPNCDVPGGNTVVLTLKMRLSSNGRVTSVEWTNRTSDPIWVAAYSRARATIAKLEPYEELPPEVYGKDISLRFDATKACVGR